MNPRKSLTAMLCLVLFSTSSVFAVDITGQSRTYLQNREMTDGTRFSPLYEYLDLRTDGTDSAVSFAAGGWYRYFLQSEGADDKDTGDLQYAYLTLRTKKADAALNLGRIIVQEGVASSQLDGVSVRADLRGGFTAAAFGGIPRETDPDTRSGDSVYGGRLAHGVPGIYTIGVSYLHEKNDSTTFRKEEGLDVWIRPVKMFEVMGTSLYNAESKDWMQHQYYASIIPSSWFRLNLEASKTWYKEYFATATTSAFSLAVLDPNEIVTATGGSLAIAISNPVTIVVDYKGYDYDVLDGSATYAGAGIVYSGASFGAGASLHRMDGPADPLRYDEQRAYVFKKMTRTDVTVDAVHIAYDQPINEKTDSWTGSAALGFTATPKFRVVGDMTYSKDPYFDRDVRAMLSMVYSFDFPLRSQTRPAAPAKSGARTKKQAR